jgi:RNA polymerase sigma factor (sigma-70 family)
MATEQMSEVIQYLRRTVLQRDMACLTDGQLLKDYVRSRDEAALAVLVQRHGPMVWGVCYRVLGNYHDAEDAFQATFLVLVRRAASIASPELLANWLYGVAHQTALKARANTIKRKVREKQVTDMPEPAAADHDLWNDLQPLLDQELSRLPEIHRAVIVLCDLQGKTRKEAARHLGLSEGTVGSRLARARGTLAKRLSGRGITLSSGALAAVLAQNAASAGAPSLAIANAIKAASLYGTGHAAAAGSVSLTVTALAEGVLKAMLLSKLKTVAVLALMLAFVVSGATMLSRRTASAQSATATPPIANDRAKGSPIPKRDALDKDVADLQGDWVVVATEDGGKKAAPDELEGMRWVIKGNEITHIEPGATEKLRLRLAPGTPKKIDVTSLDGDLKGTTEPGIYALEGRRLRVCFGKKDRPKEFATAPGDGRTLAVLEKEASTAWGEEVDGLQAGLGYKLGQMRAYFQGETVRLAVRVRNLSNEALQLHCVPAFFVETPPTVTDALGKPLRAEQFPRAEGEQAPKKVNLKPGTEIELYELKFKLRPDSEDRQLLGKYSFWNTLLPDALWGVGKVRFQYERLARPEKRALTPAEENRIRGLIRKLGDKSFTVRARASSELVAEGSRVVPLLRAVLKDSDLEIRRRAQDCLRLIDPSLGLPGAAIRIDHHTLSKLATGKLELDIKSGPPPAAAKAETQATDEPAAENTIVTLKNATIDQVDDRTRRVSFAFGSKEKPTKLLNISLADKVRVVASYRLPGSVNHLPFRWEHIKALQGKVVSVRFIANQLGVLVESISAANDAPPQAGKTTPAKILAWIEKLNADSRSITASCMTAGEISPEHMVFQRLENLSISKSARITHNGKNIAFADLKPRTGVILELDSSEGTLVGSGIEVIRQAPPDVGGGVKEGSKAGERKQLAPGITFRWCPAGKFKMGEGDGAVDVELSKGFWLGETEVTQGQWQKLMGTRPWTRGREKGFDGLRLDIKEGPEYAASYINHDDALSFCQKLTTQEQAAGRLPKIWKYTLPTEAQWEYACRAGTKTRFSFGDDESQLSEYAWFRKNPNDVKQQCAHQVGLKKPNAWGLRDMHGNVWEWCRDFYGNRLPGGKDPAVLSESFPPFGKNQVVRGGSWIDPAAGCTSANRFYGNPLRLGNGVDGFRIAAVPSRNTARTRSAAGGEEPTPRNLETWLQGKGVVDVYFAGRRMEPLKLRSSLKTKVPETERDFRLECGEGGGENRSFVRLSMRVTPDNVRRLLDLQAELKPRGYLLDAKETTVWSYPVDAKLDRQIRALVAQFREAVKRDLKNRIPKAQCHLEKNRFLRFEVPGTKARGFIDVYEIGPGMPYTDVATAPEEELHLPHLGLWIRLYCGQSEDAGAAAHDAHDAIRTVFRRAVEPFLELEPGAAVRRYKGSDSDRK